MTEHHSFLKIELVKDLVKCYNCIMGINSNYKFLKQIDFINDKVL